MRHNGYIKQKGKHPKGLNQMTILFAIKSIFSVSEFTKSWNELKSSELGATTIDATKGLIKSHNKIVEFLDAESPEEGISNRDQIKSIVSTIAFLTAEIVVKGIKDTVQVAEDYAQASAGEADPVEEKVIEVIEPEVQPEIEKVIQVIDPQPVSEVDYSKMTKKQLIAEFGFKSKMTKKSMLVQLAELSA